MSANAGGALNDGVPLSQLEVMSTNKKKGRRIRNVDEEPLSEEEKQLEIRDDPA